MDMGHVLRREDSKQYDEENNEMEAGRKQAKGKGHDKMGRASAYQRH